MNQNVIDLLKKLKALADQGIGGEKLNAQALLMKKLKELGMGIAELEQELQPIKTYYFKYENELHRRLLSQIRYSFLPDTKMFGVRKNGKSIKEVALDLSASDAIEFSTKADLYWRDFKTQQDLFYRAFVQKNNLFPPGRGEARELNREDLKVLQMAEAIDPLNYLKQLKS